MLLQPLQASGSSQDDLSEDEYEDSDHSSEDREDTSVDEEEEEEKHEGEDGFMPGLEDGSDSGAETTNEGMPGLVSGQVQGLLQSCASRLHRSPYWTLLDGVSLLPPHSFLTHVCIVHNPKTLNHHVILPAHSWCLHLCYPSTSCRCPSALLRRCCPMSILFSSGYSQS